MAEQPEDIGREMLAPLDPTGELFQRIAQAAVPVLGPLLAPAPLSRLSLSLSLPVQDEASKAEHILTRSTANLIRTLAFPYREIKWSEAVDQMSKAPTSWLFATANAEGMLVDPTFGNRIGLYVPSIPFYVNALIHVVAVQAPETETE